MRGPKTSFPFPPRELNEWRRLDQKNRRVWLTCAGNRWFRRASKSPPPRVPGREVVLDGALVDGLLGFYCAIGEAVNGPGGYFGASMFGFDDCLFSGFGLEFPYTIVWKDSARSRQVLDSKVLLEHLREERRRHDDFTEEGEDWFKEALEAAERGTRTMFDEIVETIRSVPSRSGKEMRLVLA